MNKLSFLTLAVATTASALAQSNTFPASGNVGIGTTSPAHLLDVNGTIHTPHSGIFGDGHWSNEGLNYEAISTYGGATIRGHSMVIGKFSVGTWTQSAPMNGFFVAGDSVLNGNVGIGTTNPTGKLTIAGSAGDGHSVTLEPAEVKFRSDGTAHMSIQGPTSGRAYLSIGQTSSSHLPGSASTESLVVAANGNVGIGTLNPVAPLHVNGPIYNHQNGVFFADSSLPKTNEAPWFGIGQSNLDLAGGNTTVMQVAGYYGLHFKTASGTMSVLSNGNVGIGTNSPAHKLAVNGTIKAKEIIVETTSWSDYVFADNYRLAPLSEVEAHIKTNKHLPGIPSAAQVASEGVSVGELQAKLLAKIEELTLHQIAQEKLLKAQSNELATLRAEVRTLRNQ